MPELTALHIALLVVAAIIGAVAGWILRGNRSEQEKAAVSSGWQEQIDAQRREHDRLLDQNKSLMEQVSQYSAQHTDAKNRAKELSLAVQEAFKRRDELQREIKDIRGSLEKVLSERDQLASNMQSHDNTEELLRQKDARIEKLSTELENWQNRLPPLIERFRVRNEEANQLEAELTEARERILELETTQDASAANETRIEPVEHPDELTDGLEASNDPADDFPSVDDDDDPSILGRLAGPVTGLDGERGLVEIMGTWVRPHEIKPRDGDQGDDCGDDLDKDGRGDDCPGDELEMGDRVRVDHVMPRRADDPEPLDAGRVRDWKGRDDRVKGIVQQIRTVENEERYGVLVLNTWIEITPDTRIEFDGDCDDDDDDDGGKDDG